MTKEQFKEKARFVIEDASHLTPREKSRLIRKIAKDGNPHRVPDDVVNEVLDDLNLPR